MKEVPTVSTRVMDSIKVNTAQELRRVNALLTEIFAPLGLFVCREYTRSPSPIKDSIEKIIFKVVILLFLHKA